VLIASVGQALRRVKASQLEVRRDSISFRSGFFRAVSNWNILVPISSGRIHFVRSNGSAVIHYQISFVGLFVSATVLGLIPLLVVGGPVRSGTIFAVPFIWLWLFTAD